MAADIKVGPTAGPWRQNVLLVLDANNNTIAHCTRWEGLGRNIPCPEVAEANARLIAAAPELLEACKIFLADDEARFMSGYRYAKDAIAKAEGQ